jgi:hypothetical protein
MVMDMANMADSPAGWMDARLDGPPDLACDGDGQLLRLHPVAVVGLGTRGAVGAEGTRDLCRDAGYGWRRWK